MYRSIEEVQQPRGRKGVSGLLMGAAWCLSGTGPNHGIDCRLQSERIRSRSMLMPCYAMPRLSQPNQRRLALARSPDRPGPSRIFLVCPCLCRSACTTSNKRVGTSRMFLGAVPCLWMKYLVPCWMQTGPGFPSWNLPTKRSRGEYSADRQAVMEKVLCGLVYRERTCSSPACVRARTSPDYHGSAPSQVSDLILGWPRVPRGLGRLA